jgi:hypothetical protein
MSDAPDFAVRGGLSTRIHLAVRGQAANLRFALTGGQPGDRRQGCGRGHAEQPVLPCKYPLNMHLDGQRRQRPVAQGTVRPA